MTQQNSLPEQKLVFKTIKVQNKTCCDGHKLPHRFANERNGHGHDPGYVYLLYLPRGEYEGQYKIGKTEYTKVGTDNFDLDAIKDMLIESLRKRLNNYHPSRKGTSDEKYDGAQFVHGIRVACGEGAEKQPHSFFSQKKSPLKNSELFILTEADVETFKTATGSILDHPIKHLTAEKFANHLARTLDKKTITEWIVSPNNKV